MLNVGDKQTGAQFVCLFVRQRKGKKYGYGLLQASVVQSAPFFPIMVSHILKIQMQRASERKAGTDKLRVRDEMREEDGERKQRQTRRRGKSRKGGGGSRDSAEKRRE